MGAWGLGYCEALGVTLDVSAFVPPQTTSLSSTTLSATATATGSATTSAVVPAGHHTLTTGASIAIGVGSAIAGMAMFMSLFWVGWKLLKRRREENGTEVRAEMTGTGKPAEMATINRNWHPEELPTGYEGERGVRGYADRY
ncbi:MAG: hypothetical protein M1840_000938 [Geoglossum simile]|nr:MAG: hypothetical protein M1840_000938 [Geoglossum simile]